MQITISPDEIENTEAFKKLEKVFQKMVIKLDSRQKITNAMNVYRNTGSIPSTVSGNSLKVLNELIQNSKN